MFDMTHWSKSLLVSPDSVPRFSHHFLTVCNYRCSWLTTKILQDFLNFLSPEIKAIFGQAKNYKPTWTKTSLRLVFVLRWKNANN